MPCAYCGFGMDTIDIDDDGGYVCPYCGAAQ